MGTNKGKSWMTRREFFAQASRGAVAMGCLKVGVEEAWAQARITRKPLFTVENLNKLYQQVWEQKEFDEYVKQAKTDLNQFLLQHFTLTTQQNNFIRSFTKADRDRINHFIDQVEEKNSYAKQNKVAGLPPGFHSRDGGGTCPEGKTWMCIKIEICNFSISYCWCG